MSQRVSTRRKPLNHESLEPRLTMTAAPGDLLVFYAHPSTINATFTVAAAAAEFAKYDYVVLGGGIELATHIDHANTRAIVQHPSTDGVKFFGYIELAVEKPSGQATNYSLAEIRSRADAWLDMGVDGIFLDEFGYEFQVSRQRQNSAVDHVHSLGLPVIANGWNPEDVLGNQVHPSLNPTGAATHLTATDYYFVESYQIYEGNYQATSAWRDRIDLLNNLRQSNPLPLLGVTTNSPGNPFDPAKFDYAWWSATMDGFAGFGWGEYEYAAVTASAPFRPRPALPPTADFLSPSLYESPFYVRDTNVGRIVIDPQLHTAGLNPLDWGDAPDGSAGTAQGNYRTRFSDDGARHVVRGPRLGPSIDFEPDAQIFSRFPGDNFPGVSDEDGVHFTSLLWSSPSASKLATVDVVVTNAPAGARLDAWIDFNADGDWLDAGEQIFASRLLANGVHSLNFTIPAGAVSGLTYARFRLSTAGGLGPTGSAPNGEVEDYAVQIGGPSGLAALEAAIEQFRLGNGPLGASLGPAFYDDTGKAWYMAEPYLASITLRALLAAPNQTPASPFELTASHLRFFLDRIEANGSVRRWLLSDLGLLPTTDIRIQLHNPATDSVEWMTLDKDSPTIYPDADDSSLALLILLAVDYWRAGGENHGGLLGDNNVRAKLESMADLLLELRNDAGLTRTFIEPLFPNQPIAYYLEDNLEVMEALRALAELERRFYGDEAKANKYQAAADQLHESIVNTFRDANTGIYRVLAGDPVPDLGVWYPNAQAQIWTLLQGLVPATSAEAREILDRVYSVWDGDPRGDWTSRSDSAWLAWAAVQAGDIELAEQSIASVLPWALKNSNPWPGVNDVSQFVGPQAVQSVADVGLLLQAMLPAANADHATTTVNAPVVIQVLANDYGVARAQGEFQVTIVAAPSSGTATVQPDRSIRYAPQNGFQGEDRLTYEVRAIDGGVRRALVTIRVGASPTLGGGGQEIQIRGGESPKPIFPSVTVADLDDATLAAARIVVAPFVDGVDQLLFLPNPLTMGNIGVASNSGGVMTLVSPGGTATLAQWQAALRAVFYRHSGNSLTDTLTATLTVENEQESSQPLTNLLRVDARPPTVAVNIVASTLTDAANDSLVTFTFSEPINGFTISDLSPLGGTLSQFTKLDDLNYTVRFTALDGYSNEGRVTLSGGYVDLWGNTGSSGFDTVAIDTLNPSVYVQIEAASLNAANAQSIVTFEFSEVVSQFALEDITVVAGSLVGFTQVDGNTFTATLMAADGFRGTGRVEVASTYQDAVGNSGLSGSDTVAIDTLRPSVIVNVVATLLSDNAPSSLVTFEFSEPVTGFALADITATGGVLTAFTQVDADSYTAQFSANEDFFGDVEVVVSSGYVDAAGNSGIGGSDSVTIDRRNPSVTVAVLISPLNAFSRSSRVTFEFSEPVVGFTEDDVLATQGVLTDFQQLDEDSFEATFTAVAAYEGYGIVKADNRYTDANGNLGVIEAIPVTIDTKPPTVNVDIAAITLGSFGRESQVTFIFSEPVDNFSLDDTLTLGGGLTDFVRVDERVYQARFILFDAFVGTASVTVGHGYSDRLGNFGAAATDNVIVSSPVTYDLGDAPSLSQTGFAASYPTLVENDGARHSAGGPRLGAQVDFEVQGSPTVDARGDDVTGADEDGVQVLTSLVASSGRANIGSLIVSVSTPAKLDAWIDFNRDGDWNDVGERIATSLSVLAGEQRLAIAIPAGASPGFTYGRFRVSTAGGLQPTGGAADGEVEDHRLELLNGDAGAAVVVATSLAGWTAHELEVVASSETMVILGDGKTLFEAAFSALDRLSLVGSTNDQIWNVDDWAAAGYAGDFELDAGDGVDTLRGTIVAGDNDWTQVTQIGIRGIERLDLSGSTADRLRLNRSRVAELAAPGNELALWADPEDRIEIASSDAWTILDSRIVDGRFYRVLEELGTSLWLHGPAHQQNPLRSLDVSVGGGITSLDALLVVNELNERAFSQPDGTARDPATIGGFDHRYRDVDGDGVIAPRDALLVINYLNFGEGESVEENPTEATQGLPFVASLSPKASGTKIDSTWRPRRARVDRYTHELLIAQFVGCVEPGGEQSCHHRQPRHRPVKTHHVVEWAWPLR
jgi:hypothetical protein